MNETETNYEELTITNNFIFCKVMQNKRILDRLIHLILPELEFKYISVQPQKSIEIGKDIHGVRFDMFGKGRHVYTFTNRCREDLSLELGDGTTKIVLNAAGTADDVSGGLKAFLDYIAGKPVNDEYVNEIDAIVTRAKMNKKWRAQYMTLMMRDLENRELGIEEGLKQGLEQGIEAVVSACKMLNGSPTDAIEMVVMNMGMSQEKAEEKVKMYW